MLLAPCERYQGISVGHWVDLTSKGWKVRNPNGFALDVTCRYPSADQATCFHSHLWLDASQQLHNVLFYLTFPPWHGSGVSFSSYLVTFLKLLLQIHNLLFLLYPYWQKRNSYFLHCFLDLGDHLLVLCALIQQSPHTCCIQFSHALVFFSIHNLLYFVFLVG